jgi:TatD DNase family protein
MPPSTLVDTHIHLYSSRFDADRDAVVERALQAGVERFYLPNIDAASVEPMLELLSRYPGRCFAMMGLHPCSVGADFEQDLAWVEARLFGTPPDPPYVAVGEIGLDYYWDKTYTAQQQEAYRRQLAWAAELGLPVCIHSRDSLDDTLGIIEAMAEPRLRGVFHCFNGTRQQAERALALGFYLGIGGVATYRNGGLDAVLPGLDPDFLLLETDAPYLAPVPYRGKRNEPAYLLQVLEVLAPWFGTSPEQMAAKTTANANRLFGFEAKGG